MRRKSWYVINNKRGLKVSRQYHVVYSLVLFTPIVFFLLIPPSAGFGVVWSTDQSISTLKRQSGDDGRMNVSALQCAAFLHCTFAVCHSLVVELSALFFVGFEHIRNKGHVTIVLALLFKLDIASRHISSQLRNFVIEGVACQPPSSWDCKSLLH